MAITSSAEVLRGKFNAELQFITGRELSQLQPSNRPLDQSHFTSYMRRDVIGHYAEYQSMLAVGINGLEERNESFENLTVYTRVQTLTYYTHQIRVFT